MQSELDTEPEPENKIAKGFHEAGDRRVEIDYVRTNEGVEVNFTYFEEGEQVGEVDGSMGVEDGEIAEGFWNGLTVEEFIQNHFGADPEAEVGEIFDDVVNQNS